MEYARLRILAALVVAGLLASGYAAAEDAARTVRVCADPNNLPFSNAAAAGFENRVAEVVTAHMGAHVQYVWHPEARGLVRKTLKASLCDVIAGLPAGYGPALTTTPYYRSTYVFLSRADASYVVRSLDDPMLRKLHIGVHVIGDDYNNTPPVAALAFRGIRDNVKAFPIADHYGRPGPGLALTEAVVSGEVDVAIVWGPFAGYAATRSSIPLRLDPVTPGNDPSGQRFVFDIAFGVRRGDTELARELDRAIRESGPEVARILDAYGVPTLDLARESNAVVGKATP